MTDQQQLTGTGATPQTIVVESAQQLLPKAAFATFDGSGAAGDFLPVVKLIGPGNVVAAQAVGDVVTAGASVDQTWFRGLAKPGSSGGSGGLQFGGTRHDYGPDNEGGWLYVQTNESQDTHGVVGQIGSLLQDNSGDGVALAAVAPPNGPPISEAIITPTSFSLGVDGGGANPQGISMTPVGADTFMDFTQGATVPIRLKDGRVYMLNLPTAPGAAGELYKDASGFLKVS